MCSKQKCKKATGCCGVLGRDTREGAALDDDVLRARKECAAVSESHAVRSTIAVSKAGCLQNRFSIAYPRPTRFYIGVDFIVHV